MREVKNAVITGCTGAIGLALIKELTAQGVNVYALVRPNSSRISRITRSDTVKVVECDIAQIEQLSTKMDHADVFYHFAWENTFGAAARNDVDSQIRNIQHTVSAVRAARKLGCHTFIGAGSQAEYGRVEGLLKPDTPCFPENGYGMAKLCAGQMSRVECEKLGMRHIWMRILSVYGPYDGSGTLVSSVINKLLNKQPPACTKGEQLWDYLYSADSAKAFYLAAKSDVESAVYTLGSGQARPLREYIETIRDIVAPNQTVDFGAVPYSVKQVMHLQADISSLTKDTGFLPCTPFEIGIKNILACLKED